MWLVAAAVGRRRVASIIFSTTPSISVGSRISQQQQSKRTIYSKYAVPDYAKHVPPPWPYKERGYKLIHQFMDFGVTKRLNENSKLIIVEGNTGSGKSKFSAELADALGFYYIPDPPFDDLMIDSYGDDKRLYYHLLPETCRHFDTRMFYEQPRHRNVAQYQQNRLQNRVEAYLNALAHIMNTGQGVVLERCFYTDKVFVEAMYKKGYLSDAFRWHYHKWLLPYVENEILLQAHLVVYLDCPVSKCLENIKKYHKPWEWKNEVMDYNYLEDMDKGLKFWLKEYSRHAEILTYDWSNGGDAKTVAEDIERVELDDLRVHENEKFETWSLFADEIAMTEYRSVVTSDKNQALNYFYVRPPEVEELWIPVDDMIQRKMVHDMIFGHYGSGFRPDRGDSVKEIMMASPLREETTNKKWTEYIMQDEHHLYGHDLSLYFAGPMPSPTFPEEFLKPQSPYASDGGCMASAELFLENGQMTRIPHH